MTVDPTWRDSDEAVDQRHEMNKAIRHAMDAEDAPEIAVVTNAIGYAMHGDIVTDEQLVTCRLAAIRAISHLDQYRAASSVKQEECG